MLFLAPIFSFSASSFHFNDKAVTYRDKKDSFIFLQSGKVIGIHKNTPIGMIGIYKIKGKTLTAVFTGIDGIKTQEKFYILNKNTIKYDGRILKKHP